MVAEGRLGEHAVKVMRDSGSTGCTVRRELVRGDQYTGREVNMILLDGARLRVPEVEVWVTSPFFTGLIKAAAVIKPLYDVIIGNIRGVRNAVSRDAEAQTCAATVTRAAARRKSRVVPLRVESPSDLINSEDVVQEIETDPSLQIVRKHYLEGTTRNVHGNVTRFIKKRGRFYRQFLSDRGEERLQFVVPEKYRHTVFKLGHSTALGGHMGRAKTLNRIQASFYWPNIGQDVARLVRSCDVCQRTVDRGRVKPAPRQPLPIISTPFERVAVDLVGPIEPRASDGSRYILTLVDFATRWPEAVPLRNIEASTVAEAMMGIFSRVGIPKEILSDRGTQFTSGMMDELLRLLACKGLRTSPYHPACNGLCEKFNGTLKRMLKRMTSEQPKEWPRFISPLLFAYREVPQSSLKFSPFEMLYGRAVRGPLQVLRELWDDAAPDPEVRTTYQYVLDLSDRLKSTCELAKEELLKAQEVQRSYFNKKAKLRQFNVGDRCLVLLPTSRNKLLAQWRGPYEVLEKVTDLNYVLDIDGKRKRFHINMLKAYHSSELAASSLQADSLSSEQLECLEVVRAHFYNVPAHIIEPTGTKPVREWPYPIPARLVDAVEDT